MNKTIESLLGEIRGLSRGKVEPRQIDAMVDEVRVHLDASIQARLEFSDSSVIAEEQAIQAFGDPAEFVEKMIKQHPTKRQQWFDRKVWRSLWICALVISVLMAYSSFQRFDTTPFLLTYFATCILMAAWIGFHSFRSKLPQVLPLLAFGILMAPLVAAALSLGLVAIPESPMTVGFRKVDLFNMVMDSDRRMQLLNGIDDAFQKDADQFFFNPNASGESWKPLWRPARLPGEEPRYSVARASNVIEAQREWRRLIPVITKDIARDKQTTSYDSIRYSDMLRRPLLVNVYYHMPAGLYLGAMFMMCAAVVSIPCWALGLLVRTVKRRNRPTPV